MNLHAPPECPRYDLCVHRAVMGDTAVMSRALPGKAADFLRAADLDDVERVALDQGVTVQCGEATLRVTALGVPA